MEKICLDRTSPVCLYRQIYEGLKKQILTGGLQPGEQLPSYRALCRRYGVNLATAVHAYALLEEEDLLCRRAGSGCFVRPRDLHGFFEDSIMLRSFQAGQPAGHRVLDFATTTPVPDRLCTGALRAAAQQQLSAGGDALFRYPPTQGSPNLVRALETLLADRGIRAETPDIQIISGGQQGVDLLCKALVEEGTVILVEDPAYSVAVNTFVRYGGQICRVPLEAGGPDLSALEALLRRQPVHFYYTTTRFQNPTNSVWDAAHRQRVLALASQYRFLIIEDDCMGELAFSRPAPLPLKAADSDQRVFYIQSFSKSLMPGFRLGYLVSPPQYTRRILSAKFSSDIACPMFFQETLAAFLVSGGYQQQLDRLCAAYRRKRQLMLRELQAAAHLTSLSPESDGGVSFWIRLPAGVDSYEVYEQLARVNIKILPGTAFSPAPAFRSCIRLSFVGCTVTEIRHGVAAIDRLAGELAAR